MTNIELYQCPQCKSNLVYLDKKGSKAQCINCLSIYKLSENFIDFIRDSNLSNISRKAVRTWGEDLHKETKSTPLHIHKIRDRFNIQFRKISGNVLELGFGTGTDLEELNNNENITNLTAVDIGSNAKYVAKKFKEFKKITIVRANAERLPFRGQKFDYIYSYGVIHHTKDPLSVLNECKRILKENGILFIYVYSSHSRNFLKRVGIIIENLLMKILTLMPIWFQKAFCIFITPICWLLFTIPARYIKHIGFKEIAEKLPLHWGRTPLSILPDIKDRLLAPISHRYSKKTFEKLLKKAGLESIELLEDSSGLYGVIRPI